MLPQRHQRVHSFCSHYMPGQGQHSFFLQFMLRLRSQNYILRQCTIRNKTKTSLPIFDFSLPSLIICQMITAIPVIYTTPLW